MCVNPLVGCGLAHLMHAMIAGLSLNGTLSGNQGHMDFIHLVRLLIMLMACFSAQNV